MFEFVKKIQEEKRIQKEEEITRKKIENYYAQMNRTIKYDIKMSKQSDDGIWLWDTERFVDQFMQEVKDHNLEVDMRNCNFGEFIMFIKWAFCCA